jgi:two-component system, OmpR family, osmolarity sensor histidine kinase EnvZ
MLGEDRVQARDLEDLRTDVDDMARVVEGYLAFARGEGQERIETTDLGALLRDVAERAANGSSRIDVELEAPVILPLRPTAIRRCFTNLIENAARHARWVGVRAATKHGQVWVAVDDDGPGIPEPQRETVFKPFFRLDGSRNPSTGGVGLGLTIARDIVLGHGGDIELSQAPTGGLRVLIRLPR